MKRARPPRLPWLTCPGLVALLGITFAAPALADDSPAKIQLRDGQLAPVLEGLDLPDDVETITLTTDGHQVAVALPDQDKGRNARSVVRIHRVGHPDPVVVPLRGMALDLVFAYHEIAPILYALEHRPARRREGDSHLVRIDVETAKSERLLRLPPSARDLAHWASGDTLLVAARDQIRTISLPLMRSGPLYRVPGDNRAIAQRDRTQVVVGQDTAILLIDLSDPQSRESMPVRDQVPLSAPVTAFSLSTDGSHGLARLADGQVAAIRFEPLSLEPHGRGLLAQQPAVSARIARGDDLPERSTARAPDVPTPIDASEEEEVRPSPDPPPSSARPARAIPLDDPAFVQVRGRIEGPAASHVAYLVFLGPDNLLREAARVRPDPDGTYRIGGLPPGHYAVQVDGGGKRLLITEPRTHTVLVSDESEAAADFRVLRAL